ncbi:hypothetical protein BpHYR1_018611 [Brachionus plicatilis]|uniref:Uncharacterized protein n=1 Tax=Brachionus plicatilis TaxID=10195 RepID=A0A3M7SJG8_BRAPC|nr:hypothetical protein BpHYR1_018611 [Brachionus plicatilis]
MACKMQKIAETKLSLLVKNIIKKSIFKENRNFRLTDRKVFSANCRTKQVRVLNLGIRNKNMKSEEKIEINLDPVRSIKFPFLDSLIHSDLKKKTKRNNFYN